MPGLDAELIAIVKRLGREAEASVGSHPEPESLLAYYRDKLGKTEADEMEEHLCHCTVCADLVLSIPAFLSDEGHSPSVSEIGSAWDALRVEQAAESKIEAPAALFPTKKLVPQQAQRLVRALPYAATLLLGLGAGAWLQGFANAERGPRASFRVAASQTEPGQPRGEEGAEWLVDFRSGAEIVVVVFTPAEQLGPGPFEGRVVDEQGRVWVSEVGVPASQYGTFILSVPRGTLPKGRLEAQVLDVSASPPRWVARRWMRVLSLEEP